MKILFLGFSVNKSSGGIENYTYTVLKYLESLGHEIVTCTLSESTYDFQSVAFSRNRIVDRFFLAYKIKKTLKSDLHEFDAFLCGHLFLAGLMESIIADTNKTYNLFVYGIDCWAGRFSSRAPKLKRLNKIISISSFTTGQIRAQGFGGEVVYLPPVIDASEFPGNLPEKHKNGSTTTFLIVGRLSSAERYKGHDELIESAKLLVDAGHDDFEVWVVGKGDDLERLKHKVVSAGLGNRIQFFGYVEEERLQSVYMDADVFIMPSHVSLNTAKPEGEGFGIVFIEAAMYGLPLIGPSEGGSTDIFDDGVEGLQCDAADPVDIASKMRFLMDDPKLQRQLGEAARRRVLNNFTYDQMSKYISGVAES